MNTIYTNQSTRENLDLLYAQARDYDRVKNWNRLNFLFSIIVPLLLSLVTIYNRSRGLVDSELLSSLLGLYGLLVLTFNIVISGHISALRRKAASIQEMYDCRVLGIRRRQEENHENRIHFKNGDRVFHVIEHTSEALDGWFNELH